MDDYSARIIPYYSHPHVHTVIADNTSYDETIGGESNTIELPFSTCIVTGADKGIDNTFVRLTSYKVKEALFGKANFKKYGQPSIQADELFNGSTNVWFYRALPDNATYANMILVAHYRKGKILDEKAQETGKVRMEVKYTIEYATKPALTKGAIDDDSIKAMCDALTSSKADPKTGYMTVPLMFIRSIGRGRYGNDYSIILNRDIDGEKDYGLKMYKLSLIDNGETTKISKEFTGSLYESTRYDMSTLLSDVLDQYSLGSTPIKAHIFETNFEKLFDFYHSIVAENDRYVMGAGAKKEDLAELKVAQAIDEDAFDPIFGYLLNTRSDILIPYYRNYTEKGVPYVAPDLVIPNTVGTTKPLNTMDWNNAKVGAKVLVIADPLNEGYRWLYTVESIDKNTGNIIYNEGELAEVDDDQYTGTDVTDSTGIQLIGGHDGEFEEITVGGTTRVPTPAELKLLLSKEYVKAFHGVKDKKILSPVRVSLDFIFDANYNMTADETLNFNDGTANLYNNSTVLTNEDYQALTVLTKSGQSLNLTDINVKSAMYDLVTFRNKNGMTVSPEMGAGCHLYLDTGMVGIKNLGANRELMSVIRMMDEFTGRYVSVDLGYYTIIDNVSRKKVDVTATFLIAKNLIPHLMREGLNKPFVNSYAQLTSIQRSSSSTITGDMIRDSFKPDIDLIDWDVKEMLFKSRINYWVTSEEGRVMKRACQNTRQLDPSALLEENNVRVLNVLKRGLDKSCQDYTYNWNDPHIRKGFTDEQMNIYRPWIGNLVEDIDIIFEANEWERQRMIMHCYCSVKFRDIIKRIILEIGIRRTGGRNQGGEA